MTHLNRLVLLLILLLGMMQIAQAQQNDDTPNVVDMIARFGDSPAQAVAVHGEHAYVGFGSQFTVIDLSDITNPTVIGQLEMAYPIDDILLHENYVYTTSGVGGVQLGDGFQVIDVSDPENPVQVNDYIIRYLLDFRIVDEHIYLIDNSYLKILDISNPFNILELGNFQEPSQNTLSTVVVKDEIAFAMNANPRDMYVLDIANPTHPIMINAWDGLGALARTQISQNDVYFFASNTCSSICLVNLTAFDFSDVLIEFPPFLDSFPGLGSRSYVLELDTLYAYVGSDLSLIIFNIADPRNIIHVGALEVPDVKDVAVTADHLFLATADGFWIVQSPPTYQYYLPLIQK